MVSEIEREFTRGRYFADAIAAASFAGHDAVQSFIDQSPNPENTSYYLRRVVYQLAKVDLDATVAMVEKSLDRNGGVNNANCYGNIAMAIYEDQPERAKELLRKAFQIAGQSNTNDLERSAFTFLRYAQFVDPDSTGEYWWRAVAAYGGLDAGLSNRPQQMEMLERRAGLALLLTLYGQYPELEAELVEPLFKHWEAVPVSSFAAGTRGARDGIDFRNSLSTFAAMALHDPERTTKMIHGWWPEGYQRFNRSPDSPWILVSEMLTASDDQLHRLICKRIHHLWILGDSSQY